MQRTRNMHLLHTVALTADHRRGVGATHASPGRGMPRPYKRRTDRTSIGSCLVLFLISSVFIGCGKGCSKTNPLLLAAGMGKKELIITLIEQGNDVNSPDLAGRTPLHWAVQMGRYEAAKVLIKHGARLDSRTKHDQNTPLHEAIRRGAADLKLIKLLVENHASIHAKNRSRETPLHMAATVGKVPIVKYLLREGADVNAVDVSKTTPWDHALKNRHKAIVDELHKHGGQSGKVELRRPKPPSEKMPGKKSGPSSNVVTAKEEVFRILREKKSGVLAMSVNRRRKEMAVAMEDGSIKLWDYSASIMAQGIAGHKKAVVSVSYSPNGRIIASGSMDHSVRLWDSRSGKMLAELQGHSQGVTGLAFSKDGKLLASGSLDHMINIWNLRSRKKGRRLSGYENQINGLGFGQKDQIIVSASSKRLLVWDVLKGKPRRDGRVSRGAVRSFGGYSGTIYSLAIDSKGSRVASGAWDRTVRLWELKTGKELKVFSGHKGKVNAVAFSPDGKAVASGSQGKNVIVWKIESGKKTWVLKGHDGAVSSVVYVGDNVVASGSMDGTVRFWNTDTGRCLGSLLFSHGGWAVLSGDGRYKIGGDIGKGVWFAKGLERCVPSEASKKFPKMKRLTGKVPLFEFPQSDPRKKAQ